MTRWTAALLTAAALLAGAAAPARGSIVLLDEHWLPEIVQNDVKVTEVDTEATDDPTQAVSGFYSVRLENETGWPSVRFRGAPALKPGDLEPDRTDVTLWYRTDRWNGKLQVQVWVRSRKAGRIVNAMHADLDGGGVDGRFIADDQWHQARGKLVKGPEYDQMTDDEFRAVSYIWLRATDGWDVAHRTYIDRVEARSSDGALPPPATRRVPAVPGAQVEGPDIVWWEGENAVEPQAAPADMFLPRDAVAQQVLSNGYWIHKHRRTNMDPVHYRLKLPQDANYTFWARGYFKQGSFRWRWDDGEYHTSAPDLNVSNWAMLLGNWLPVGWARLGQEQLSAGEHTLEIEPMEAPLGLGFDCFVLARAAFVPAVVQSGGVPVK